MEPPGPPNVRADFHDTFKLTADAPVAVRTVEFTAIPGAMAVRGVGGYLEVVSDGGGGPGGVVHDDVWVSILDVESGGSSDSVTGNGHASVDGWGHAVSCGGVPALASPEIAPNPQPTCHARWTVVARWLDPKPGVEVPLELNGRVSADARSLPGPSETFSLSTLSVKRFDAPTFDGLPAMTQARVKGSARITPTSPPETRHFVLRVPAALLLKDAALYPSLGRIFVGTTVTDWTGPPVDARVTLTIGDRVTAPYGGTAGELDWLPLCRLRVTCELPVDVTVSYWETQGSGKTPTPGGFMALDWTIEARLEDFSPKATMPAGLELVEH